MTNKENLLELAENVPKVYESGNKVGIDAGKKSEYDAFWDAYQQNGTRKDYTNGFGTCWAKESFKPKYDLKVTNAYMMFRYMPITGDFVELLNQLGVELDFSNATNIQYCFFGARMSRLGVIDIRKATSATCDSFISSMPNLVTIDLIKVSANNNCNWLASCPSLENVTFEGEIAKNFNVQWSTKLSKASIESIINALSADTSGLTVTLSQTAVDNAFTAEEWDALEATKTNWTISLV